MIDTQLRDQTVPDADLVGRAATIAALRDPASSAKAQVTPAAGGTTLPLSQFKLALDHGLLMVFGPEDDPVPPRAFAAAVAEQPEAMLALPDGAAVPALRVAAVLETQASGQLQPHGDGDDLWVRVMLGLGPQPEEASPAELQAEGENIGLAAFGNELMLRLPSGGSLVIVDAKSSALDDEATIFFLPNGDTIAVRNLIGLLRANLARPGATQDTEMSPGASPELTVPISRVEVEADVLVLGLPVIGDVRLATVEGAPPDQPRISVFLPSGEAASVPDLLPLFDPERPEEPVTLMVGALSGDDAVDRDASGALPLDIMPADDSGNPGSVETSPDETRPAAIKAEETVVGWSPTLTFDEPRKLETAVETSSEISASDGHGTVAFSEAPDAAAGDPNAEALIAIRPTAASIDQPNTFVDDVTSEVPDDDRAAETGDRSPMDPLDDHRVAAWDDDETDLTADDHPTLCDVGRGAAVANLQHHGPSCSNAEPYAAAEPGVDAESCAAAEFGMGVELGGMEPDLGAEPHSDVEPDLDAEPCVEAGKTPCDLAPELRSNQPIALTPHLEWEAVEPNQPALVIIGGVPKGVRLSAGADNGDGSWSVSPAEIDGLMLLPPESGLPEVILTFTAVGLAGRDGDLVTHMTTTTLSATQAVIDTAPSRAPHERAVSLDIDAQLAAGGTHFDAVIVRGVPRDARLSSGTFDPAIDGWALLPGHLPGLTMTVAGDPTTDVELTFVGITLGPGAPNQSRLLAVLPVATA